MQPTWNSPFWMKRVAALALALAIVSLAAGGAVASRRGGPHGPGRMLAGIERGADELDLTPETRKSLDAILDAARDQQRALRPQLRAAHEQMRSVLDADSPATETVLAQADSIGALETQSKKLELQAVIEVRKLLTPEQWKQLREQQRPGGPGCRHDDDEKPS